MRSEKVERLTSSPSDGLSNLRENSKSSCPWLKGETSRQSERRRVVF